MRLRILSGLKIKTPEIEKFIKMHAKSLCLALRVS